MDMYYELQTKEQLKSAKGGDGGSGSGRVGMYAACMSRKDNHIGC
jgi:hypothetical protein